jgi:hypothetical protein
MSVRPKGFSQNCTHHTGFLNDCFITATCSACSEDKLKVFIPLHGQKMGNLAGEPSSHEVEKEGVALEFVFVCFHLVVFGSNAKI